MIDTIAGLKDWVNDEKRNETHLYVSGYCVWFYHSGCAVYKGEAVHRDALICTFMSFYEEEMYAALAAILRLSDS